MTTARTAGALVAAGACLILLATPDVANASGFEVPDNGTRSLGRGGAYAAGVDEPSAIYYNPAALTRIDGPAVTANLNLIQADITFQRESFEYSTNPGAPDPNGFFARRIDFDEVQNEAGYFPAPMLFAAHDFGLEDWSFGFGVYGPSSVGAKRFPGMEVAPDDFNGDVLGVYVPERGQPITRDGGQAYMNVEYNLLLVFPSLAVSHRFRRVPLSLGITAQAALLWIDYTVGVDGIFGEDAINVESIERQGLYSETRLETFGVTATGIIGLLYEPWDFLAIGLSYRPRLAIQTEGDLTVDFPKELEPQNPRLDTTSAGVEARLPDVVRLGVEYTHRNRSDREIFDVEANVVYEGWSFVDGFDVRLDGSLSDDTGAVQDQKLPNLFLERYYTDSWSVRLGSDLSMLRDPNTGNGPVFRLGGYWESGASPEAWTNMDFTPFERFAGAIGASYHIGAFSIDAAFSMAVSPSRTVDNGKYEMLTPLWICNDPSNAETAAACADAESPGHAVNNGTYDVAYRTISLGLTWGW